MGAADDAGAGMLVAVSSALSVVLAAVEFVLLVAADTDAAL